MKTLNHSDIYSLIILLFLCTYVWRFWGVILSQKIIEGGEINRYCRFLSISVISAMVWKMILFPTGTLMETSDILRIVTLGLSVVIYYVSGRNMIIALIGSCVFFYVFITINFFT